VCVECLIGKQKKPILFKVTKPSSIPYRAPSACAKRAAYPDPPPVIPASVPDSDTDAAQPEVQTSESESPGRRRSRSEHGQDWTLLFDIKDRR